jgi:hypothetical protein
MVLSWAFTPVISACSGSPLRSHSTWYFLPALPRSVGLGPPAGPVQQIVLGEPVEHEAVQPPPAARLLPLAQPAPARDAGPQPNSRDRSF